MLGAWAMQSMGYAVLCNAQPHINLCRTNLNWNSSSPHSYLSNTNAAQQNRISLLSIPITIPHPLECSFIVHLWDKVLPLKIAAGTFSVHQNKWLLLLEKHEGIVVKVALVFTREWKK